MANAIYCRRQLAANECFKLNTDALIRIFGQNN